MRISFPTSIPTIPRVDVSSIYVGSDSMLERTGFADAMNARVKNGARIVQFGGYQTGLKADTIIAWSMRSFRMLQMLHNRPIREDVRYGLLVFPEHPEKRPKMWFRDYQKASENKDVSIIVIPSSNPTSEPCMDGILRIIYLNRLVEDGYFCTEKPHWLYGVPNPAELSVYRELFSNFIESRIELAICSMCFLYSIFGIQFSTNTGIMHRLEEIHDTRIADLGMFPWVDYKMSREQMRCFHMNVDMVQSFAGGLIADDYMDRVHAILKREE